MAGQYGVKETLEFINGAKAFTVELNQWGANNREAGKIQFRFLAGLGDVFKLRGSTLAAIQGAELIPDEIGELDDAELQQVGNAFMDLFGQLRTFGAYVTKRPVPVFKPVASGVKEILEVIEALEATADVILEQAPNGKFELGFGLLDTGMAWMAAADKLQNVPVELLDLRDGEFATIGNAVKPLLVKFSKVLELVKDRD